MTRENEPEDVTTRAPDAVSARAPSTDRGKVVDWTILAVGLVILFVVPHHLGADGEARFATLDRFLTTGDLTSPRYSAVLPILATPFWLVGSKLGDARGATALFNPVLFAAALALIARDLRHDVGPRTRRAVLLLLVFGSMFPNHLTVFYGEVLTALAVTLGTLWLGRGRTRLGWSAIVLGAVNTPGALIGVAAIALRMAHRTRRLGHLLAPAVVFALCRLESLVVRGGLFVTGYEGDAGAKTALPYSGLPGFSYPFFLGVLAILFSFGKGLVFFAPGLLAPVEPRAPERLRWVQRTLLLFVLGLVVVYARWWSWYGGSFWGPRFFLAASVPSALTLALAASERRARSVAANALLVLAVLLSCWVGVNGLVFDQTGLGLCSENGYALESFCLYVPEMSVLWHPFVDFASSVPAKSRLLAIALSTAWMGVGVWLARDLLADLGRGAAEALRAIARELRTPR